MGQGTGEIGSRCRTWGKEPAKSAPAAEHGARNGLHLWCVLLLVAISNLFAVLVPELFTPK